MRKQFSQHFLGNVQVVVLSQDYLDPNDIKKTIEGYPAPMRATLIATKKKR